MPPPAGQGPAWDPGHAGLWCCPCSAPPAAAATSLPGLSLGAEGWGGLKGGNVCAGTQGRGRARVPVLRQRLKVQAGLRALEGPPEKRTVKDTATAATPGRAQRDGGVRRHRNVLPAGPAAMCPAAPKPRPCPSWLPEGRRPI